MESSSRDGPRFDAIYRKSEKEPCCARTDQMNKRQKTAQYRRYIDFGELLKLDNNRLDKKTLHKQRKDLRISWNLLYYSRYDREEDGLPFERPDGHQIRSCKTSTR